MSLAACQGPGGAGATARTAAPVPPPAPSDLVVYRFAVAGREIATDRQPSARAVQASRGSTPAAQAMRVGSYFAAQFQTALVAELRRLGVPAAAAPERGRLPTPAAFIDGQFLSRGAGVEMIGFSGDTEEIEVLSTVAGGPPGATPHLSQIESRLTASGSAVPVAELPPSLLTGWVPEGDLLAVEKGRLTDGAERAARLVVRDLVPALRAAGWNVAAVS